MVKDAIRVHQVLDETKRQLGAKSMSTPGRMHRLHPGWRHGRKPLKLPPHPAEFDILDCGFARRMKMLIDI